MAALDHGEAPFVIAGWANRFQSLLTKTMPRALSTRVSEWAMRGLEAPEKGR